MMMDTVAPIIGNMVCQISSPVYILETTAATNDAGVVDEIAGRFKVVVVGDEQCGKTSLLYSFSRKCYESEHPVVFEEDISTIRFGTKIVDLVLWDLSGCTEYDGFRCELYKDTDLFIVCFDIGNPQSLENTQEIWIPEILREEPRTPFMLVGCKNDLRTDYALGIQDITQNVVEHAIRCDSVTRQWAEKVGTDWGGKEYIECCAKTGYHTSEVFRTAAQVLLSPLDEKNGGLKGLSRFARRKSSEISGLFADSFLSPNKSNLRRKSSEIDDPQVSKLSFNEKSYLALPPQIYGRTGRRSSAYA